jgi:hypothetical protein
MDDLRRPEVFGTARKLAGADVRFADLFATNLIGDNLARKIQ